jgi:hypothetical protein
MQKLLGAVHFSRTALSQNQDVHQRSKLPALVQKRRWPLWEQHAD